MDTVEVTRNIMGGRFYIKAFPQPFYSKEQTEQILQTALDVAKDIEDELTDFRASPFQQINLNAGIKVTPVNSRILYLFNRSVDYTKQSGGLFDISAGPLIHLWRREKAGEKIEENEWDSAKSAVGIDKVEVNQIEKTIFLPSKNMRISFGGIGKGYAVDQLFEYLREKGIENFYVNGSGDIRVHSHPNAPRPWRIGLQNPFSLDYKDAGVIQLRNEACATSGTYKNRSDSKKRANHIINPFTGNSPTDIVSCTVIGESSLETDVRATTIMLLDSTERKEFIEKHQLKVIAIDQSGKVLMSKALLTQVQN